MVNDLIEVTEAANLLEKHKAYIFKLIERFSIEKIMQKSSSSHGQTVAFISQSDFEQIKSYVLADTSDDNNEAGSSYSGVFYLIQLEPKHDPGRLKLGFATNIEERLRTHRTTAPFSKVLRTWPCKLLWEKTAIECVSQDCEKLHTEVFRTQSIENVKARGDSFFALMPNLLDDF